MFNKYDEQLLDRYSIDFVGTFALHLLERWGLVAAKVEGQRRQGREDHAALPCLRGRMAPITAQTT